jgi:ERCC4-type nuclease
MTLKVTIDSREKDRRESATKYFTSQGITVEIAELPIGDYIFTNGKESVVFEFKLVADFVSSIQSCRVFNQAISQSESYNHHFVIICGDDHARAKAIAMSKHYQPVNLYQYNSAIASLNRYTTVIESYSPFINEAYHRMQIQAEKCLLNRPIVKKFEKKHKNPARNWLAYCVYGVSGKKAQNIVNELDLHTLEDLLYLDEEKLTSIGGIGKKLAERIVNTIQSEAY